MTLLSRVAGRLANLPPATNRTAVAVDRDLQVPLHDGVHLLADRWYPSTGQGDPRLVLVAQSPYGRRTGDLVGRLIAERGFQVVIVSCRGTFGSGGDFTPFHNEPDDAGRVVGWVQAQPWCPPEIALFGYSYLGSPLWSVATEAPPSLRAVTVGASSARFHDLFYPGGTFGLENALQWIYRLETQELPTVAKQVARVRRRAAMNRGYAETALREADRAAVGRTVTYYQDWLEHYRDGDVWWHPVDYRSRLTTTVPASLVAGWYDLFLSSQLADYAALRSAGSDVRLSVGPWTHSSRGLFFEWVREIITWSARHAADPVTATSATSVSTSTSPSTSADDEDRVRLFVMGAQRWVGFADWPPPAETTAWYLQPGKALSPEPPVQSGPDRYHYDPTDPTPSVGGANLSSYNSGAKDNRRIEARDDVLTYTSEPLAEPLTVIGTPVVTLHVAASNPNTDFSARLCDVAPNGRSTNLTDGVYRLSADPGERGPVTTSVRVQLAPTANTFRRGHRIRLQVASGAHPLYARNLGNGLPLGTPGPMVGSDQEIYHDPDRASLLELPVVDTVDTVDTVRKNR